MTEDRATRAKDLAEARRVAGIELENAQAESAKLRQQLLECEQQAHAQARAHVVAGEELQHRARNTMALVRSAFERTVDTGKSLEDVEMHFCGRLNVLAHYMLPRSGRADATVDVENLIRDELRNFEFGDADGILIKGPDAALSLEQAQSFALVIHELVTNSLKFGALSIEDAALSVTWDIHDGHLKLVWAETGVPIVMSAPVPNGFGREFIEQALPYQIGAITQFTLRPGGALCTIIVPLRSFREDDSSGAFRKPALDRDVHDS